MSEFILAVDQGTTGTTAVVVDRAGTVRGRCNVEFSQHYPRPGWVEHDVVEVWNSVRLAVQGALADAPAAGHIAAIGLTNQRETAVAWDRDDGAPLHHAIVWQDRRTAEFCQELEADGQGAFLRERTGLVIDPYFSASKFRWLLQNSQPVADAAARGRLCLGTIDGFLLFKLTGGEHLTDVTNACRTQLLDLRSRTWVPELCELFEVPRAALAEVRPSAGAFGATRGVAFLPDGIPIYGVAGDQHAALFGQGCFRAGDAKCTYGTGAFVLTNTGNAPVFSDEGLLTTIAWQLQDEVAYALEGSCFIAGAAVQWLRDGLGLFDSAGEVEALARSVPDAGGVVFVPALAGLAAPYWRPEATGMLSGITRGTTRAHVARATLEAIAFQVDDLLRSMSRTAGGLGERLLVDGGAAANDLLLELQAGISGLAVQRPQELESTARGAAWLAGVGAGWFTTDEIAREMIRTPRQFDGTMSESERERERRRWARAIDQVMAGCERVAEKTK